ncbi:brain and acute leukemia cytoplasmic protein [Siniperca chuatsi]|uniref:brain and acute leukemia cytoplasmic protein n=1 Tax=Siniperca chuatsi TaxID=119488 RepID=UPI001CE0D791|nr:brain and acute leukemia cytoplasmic protein [Siniperca chuatsi]
MLVSCCLWRAASSPPPPAAAAAAVAPADDGNGNTDGAAVEIRGGCCGCCATNQAVFSPCQLHLPWMIFPMGCGGSRADAIIEPRYHESWTRETESTWLTNTDVETSLTVANSKALEASLREKRMVNTGTQCGKQALTSTGSNHQRRPRRSLSDQTTRDSKRRASKEASALSKDGQPVSINSSGDGEPGNVCDER